MSKKWKILIALLYGVVIFGAVVAAKESSHPSSGKQLPRQECAQIQRSVAEYTQKWLPARENQVVHCRSGYVMFEVHEKTEHRICRAQIYLYRPGEYIPMFGTNCILHGFDAPPRKPAKKDKATKVETEFEIKSGPL